MKSIKNMLSVLVCLLLVFSVTGSTFAEVLQSRTVYSGTCGENLTWTFDTQTGVLEIAGYGDMTDYSAANLVPWYNLRSYITSIVFPAEISYIGQYAFYECEVVSIIIPDSVTAIGQEAFRKCNSLVSAVVGNGVTKIWRSNFRDCEMLETITIGESLTYLAEWSICGCQNLETVFFLGPRPFGGGGQLTYNNNLTVYYCLEYSDSWTNNGTTNTYCDWPILPGCTVCFIDSIDDQLLSRQLLIPGTGATAPEPPEHAGYSFIGWSDDYSLVLADLSIYTVYEPAVFNVVFTDGFGSTISEQQVPYHGAATAPADPTHEGYTFTGWDADFSCIEDDLIVNATWDINHYIVTFTDGFGSTISEQQVPYHGAATAPADPTHEGYTFTGWDADFSCIEDDLTVNATWDINYYTVAFIDSLTGETISSQSIAYESAATAPEPPEHEGYSFIGWSCGFDCITEDLIVYTQYESCLLLGDADNNGIVDSVDALLILRYALGIIDSLPSLANADVTGDGIVDSADALLVLRCALGIITL